MTKLLCQINDEGFDTKPTDIKFMGRLRDKMIQRPWAHMDEEDFVTKVCYKGHAFYGCIFNGHDLMETGKQRDCWRAQTIVAADIDKDDRDPVSVIAYFMLADLTPWLVYPTFSEGKDGKHSYRIMWKVVVDHSVTYDQWKAIIKALGEKSGNPDKHAQDCTRMWQGSHGGAWFWMKNRPPFTYKQLKKKLG